MNPRPQMPMHDGEEKCPNYFDGCHCKEFSLEQMAEMLNREQLEHGTTLDELEKLKDQVDLLFVFLDEFYPMPVGLKSEVRKIFGREIKNVKE